MLAGFRMFPATCALAGCGKTPCAVFHDAVEDLPRRVPHKLHETVRRPPHEEPDLGVEAHEGRGVLTKQDTMDYGLVGPSPALRESRTTSAGRSGTRHETYQFDVPIGTAGDVYDRYLVRSKRCGKHAHRKAGARAHHAARRVRHSGLPDRAAAQGQVYAEMEALIQHFLIQFQGFTVPAGEPTCRSRGRVVSTVSASSPRTALTGRIEIELRAPSFYACPPDPEADHRRHDCRRHRRHRFYRRRDGRRQITAFTR